VNNFKYSKLSAPDVVRRFLQKCRFALRKLLFYPLNYGNSDICDFRFSTAIANSHKCCLRRDCTDGTAASVLSHTGNYPAIQSLVSRQDAICRELFERALATAFTQFARQIRAIPIP
jgi:hypothetical protein